MHESSWKLYPSTVAEHLGTKLAANDSGPLLPVGVDMASKHISEQRLAKEAMRTAGLVHTQHTNGYNPPAITNSPNRRSGNLQEWNGGTGGRATNDPPKVEPKSEHIIEDVTHKEEEETVNGDKDGREAPHTMPLGEDPLSMEEEPPDVSSRGRVRRKAKPPYDPSFNNQMYQ